MTDAAYDLEQSTMASYQISNKNIANKDSEKVIGLINQFDLIRNYTKKTSHFGNKKWKSELELTLRFDGVQKSTKS